MSRLQQPLVSDFNPPHSSLRAYVVGFVSCLGLTLLAYATATTSIFHNTTALLIIAGLAIIQCILQLVVFLHLGREFKPRWKLTAFILMLIIVLIVVLGSLWIMSNLNYRTMRTPMQVQQYVSGQDGL